MVWRRGSSGGALEPHLSAGSVPGSNRDAVHPTCMGFRSSCGVLRPMLCDVRHESIWKLVALHGAPDEGDAGLLARVLRRVVEAEGFIGWLVLPTSGDWVILVFVPSWKVCQALKMCAGSSREAGSQWCLMRHCWTSRASKSCCRKDSRFREMSARIHG